MGPRLEKTLNQLKKQEQSIWGELRNASHVWLTRIETHPWIQTYGRLLRKTTGENTYLSEPSIDLNSVFPLSLLFHLLLILLLIRISVSPPALIQETPVVVRILDLGEPAPETRKETAKQASRSTPQPRPKPVTVPAPVKLEEKPIIPVSPSPQESPEQPTPTKLPPPVLPGPKVLASPPRDNIASLAPQPIESLVQLPTRQTDAGSQAAATRVDVLPKAAETRETGAVIPESLRRSSSKHTGTPGASPTPSVLSSPDFGPYFDMIKKRVRSMWKYPEGISGEHNLRVVIVLDRAGKLITVNVVESSDPRLNNSALQALKAASPFPPIPESLKTLAGDPISVNFNIDFGLRGVR